MEHLSVAACVVAAIAVVLSGISMSRTSTMNGRADDLATGGVATTASSSFAVTSNLQHTSLSKAVSTLSLHSICSENIAHCTDLMDSMNKLTTGLSCDKVNSGHFSAKNFDIVVTANNKVLCNGPKFANHTGEDKAVPT
jgi:hypothetical protein